MAYSLTYSYVLANQSYSVTGYSGITTSDKVVIPSTYDDGTNGEHPVTSIGSNAFQKCSSLTSVTIGNRVTSIGSNAFSSCSSLTSVAIPDSVISIGDHAFDTCRSLTNVTIGNRVESIGKYTFANCNNLASITIPDSVISIEECTFGYCTGLKRVTIGNSVESIGIGAFLKCSLTSVAIPNSVTSIAGAAFGGCTSLTQLILFPSAPPTLDLGAIPSNIQSIYVQQSSKEAYQTATNWNAFASKIVSDNIYMSFVRFNQKNKEYINGKVDNRLIAPTTPTSDSAVTMLADGTVGTKPLSEFKEKIYDEDNNKQYTYQLKIKDGFPVLTMVEAEATI